MTSASPESFESTTGRSPTVSWFELFYDLVVVAAVGLTNDVFLGQPSAQNAVLSVVTMTALAWVWFLTTLYNNMFPGQDLLRRLLMLVQMGALAIAGLAVDQVHGIDNSAGLIAYAAALVIVAALIVRGSRTTGTAISGRSVAPLIVAALICLVGAADGEYRSGLYLITAMAASMVPILLTQYSRWSDASMIRLEHLRERLGLFVLIVLGEGFAQLVSALHFLGAIPRRRHLRPAVHPQLRRVVDLLRRHLLRAHEPAPSPVAAVAARAPHPRLRDRGDAGHPDPAHRGRRAGAGRCGAGLLRRLPVAGAVLLRRPGLHGQGPAGSAGLDADRLRPAIVTVGLTLVPRDATSTYAVIGLSAAIVIVNAIIAVWADVATDRHQWRRTLGHRPRGRQSPRPEISPRRRCSDPVRDPGGRARREIQGSPEPRSPGECRHALAETGTVRGRCLAVAVQGGRHGRDVGRRRVVGRPGRGSIRRSVSRHRLCLGVPDHPVDSP